jgi:hypothetical protein
MSDIKKFLDQGGVSTLWSRIAEELNKKAAANDVYTKDEVDGKISAIPVYDDTALAGRVSANEGAIAILNGDVNTAGSVAFQIAEIVAGADADFDTLKEIAEWIAAHPESVTALQNAIADNTTAISDLAALVGDTAVATQIADAITAALKIDGADKYALASDLSNALLDIATNTGDIATLKTTVAGLRTDLDALGQMSGGELNKINSISVNGVAQEIDANKNVNIEIPAVQAMSTEDIDAAIANAANQA